MKTDVNDGGGLAVAAHEVQVFRERLQRHGFVRANSSGELTAPGTNLMVRTSYVMGEYSIDCWLRERGSVVTGSFRRVRLNSRTEAGVGELIADSLIAWVRAQGDSKATKKARVWPPAILAVEAH